jgi:hypothetical protein
VLRKRSAKLLRECIIFATPEARIDCLLPVALDHALR